MTNLKELRDELYQLSRQARDDANQHGVRMTDKMYAVGVSDGYQLAAEIVDKHRVAVGDATAPPRQT